MCVDIAKPSRHQGVKLTRPTIRGGAILACVGQSWLELERAMGIENTALETIIF